MSNLVSIAIIMFFLGCSASSLPPSNQAQQVKPQPPGPSSSLEKRTLLETAIQNKDEKQAILLLNQGAGPLYDRLVELAHAQGLFELLRLLIDKGLATNLEITKERIKSGDLEYVRLLSKHKRFVSEKNNLDYYLREAALGGHHEIVKFLIAEGADPKSFKWGWMQHYNGKNIAVLKVLIEAGAPVGNLYSYILSEDETDDDFLMWLLVEKKLECGGVLASLLGKEKFDTTEKLIKAGVKISDDEFYEKINYAVGLRKLDVLKRLFEVVPNKLTPERLSGVLPKFILKGDNEDLFILLVEKGAIMNLKRLSHLRFILVTDLLAYLCGIGMERLAEKIKASGYDPNENDFSDKNKTDPVPLQNCLVFYGLTDPNLEQVKDVFKKLTRTYHPDLCTLERKECLEQMNQVNFCYEVLKSNVRDPV